MALLLSLKNSRDKDDKITRAAEILKNGGIAIFPTETVYGMGAFPNNRKAVDKIYELKGRDFKNPLAFLVSNEKIVYTLSDTVPRKAIILMQKLWPGALTIVLSQKTGGTIGVRMPDNETALKLISKSGGVLAVTSVNKSGEKEALCLEDADPSITDKVDIILDEGKCLLRKPSTVLIFMNDDEYEIIREGTIKQAQIEEALKGL